jgi:CDP-4-dehydro-6-deoxyglucose reductase
MDCHQIKEILMPQLLTLSRAARLVGVTRSALQKKIQNGELSTFEGHIAVTELLRAYPATQMQDTTMLERVERIKAKANYQQREDESALPSPKVLMTRLTALSQELVSVKSELKNTSEWLETIKQKLTELEKTDDAQLRVNIRALYDWLTMVLDNRPKLTESAAQLLTKDTILRIMAAQIKIIPSGHEFFVEGNESILEAALRAGLAINYGCSSGNCGYCKARVVSGQVQKIRHHDYVLSDAEKNMGYTLMCSHTAVTDLTLEAAEAHSVADIPLQEIEAKVKKLERLAENLLILHLQTPRTQTLRFFAGQSVTLTLPNRLSTDFFIASCPCDGRNLQFHLHQTEANPTIQTWFNKLKTGQTLQLQGPQGDFILTEDSTRPALFIAYAEGFAPIKSLIEHAMALDTLPSYHLYWIVPATEENGHYQNNLCRAWADALDHFNYTPLFSSEQETSLTQTLTSIKTDLSELNDFDVYLSGPESVVTMAKTLLLQDNLPESQCHTAIVS